MNIKKFMIMGMVSLFALVGCGTAQQTASQNVNQQAEGNTKAQAVERTAEDQSRSVEKSSAVEEPEVDPAKEKQAAATNQIQALASLIGKKAEEVDAVLGEPASIQNLEDTDILLVRYYKIEYLDEIAKVEVVFNDNEQVVNYISFVILKADDIEATKENFINTLTELYGESTIERYLDVKGRLNRNWTDETLTYELTYYENNIALDIYPSDK